MNKKPDRFVQIGSIVIIGAFIGVAVGSIAVIGGVIVFVITKVFG